MHFQDHNRHWESRITQKGVKILPSAFSEVERTNPKNPEKILLTLGIQLQ